MTLLAPPGAYTVKLTAGGRELSQPLTVKKDPHSTGTEAEIQQQTKMLEELRRDAETTATMVNQIELIRSQLQNLPRIIEAGREADVRKAAVDLEQKLIAIEGALVELRLTGRGQDGVRWGSKLLGKINYLANGLASADNQPTSQQLEVQKLLEERMAASGGQLDALMGKELAAFNDLLRRRSLPTIVASAKGGS